MTGLRGSAIRGLLPIFALSACGPGLARDDAGYGVGVGVEDIENPWLLAIDEDEGTIDALIQISVEPGAEGQVTVLCEDLGLPPGFPETTNFTSLASVGGVLYASAMRETWGDTLLRVDACTCTTTEVGGYGFDLVSGLASTRDGMLLGLAAGDDLLIEIDPATANAEQLGPLAEDWVSNGLSAGPNAGQLFGLNAQTDRLHLIRAADGVVLDSVLLSEDFLAVGLEHHTSADVIYACGVLDRETALFAVDPDTGVVSLVAESVFTTTCDNLAAPDSSGVAIDCVG